MWNQAKVQLHSWLCVMWHWCMIVVLQVLKICCNATVLTSSGLFQLLQKLIRQLNIRSKCTVYCRWMRQIEQYIWNASWASRTHTGTDSVCVPVPSNLIQIRLNYSHEAVSQTLNFLMVFRMKSTRFNESFKQFEPKLAAITAKERPPGFNPLIAWRCAVSVRRHITEHKCLNGCNSYVLGAAVCT